MVFMPDSIDDDFLSKCTNLKIVAGALKGYDNFDVDACTRRNIWFSIIPDLLTIPTADLAIGLLIGLTRRVIEGDRFIRAGQFKGWRPKLYGTGVTKKCAGIIGIGALGQAVAKRLAGFDMQIIYTDIRPVSKDTERALGLRYVSLDALLKRSHFILLCVSLTRDTYHLINEDALMKVRRGSYLINICRGSVVDEDAVTRSLEMGHLGGYAADVYEFEDWTLEDKPEKISESLLGLKSSTLFTPHLGSAVDDVRREIELEAARNILLAFQGKTPTGAINSVCRDRNFLFAKESIENSQS
jgi:phosphonate dehydrogenase